jgi:hypothetical protein
LLGSFCGITRFIDEISNPFGQICPIALLAEKTIEALTAKTFRLGEPRQAELLAKGVSNARSPSLKT